MSERRKYKEWFRFSSAALSENEELHVVRFSGREGLNELFSFTIDLVCRNPRLDTGKILHTPAEFSILRKKGEPAVFRGYPTRMDQGGHFNGWTYYTVELGPACKRLTRIRKSAVFLNKDVRDTARELLNSQPFFTFPHEFRLTRDYPVPEFAMQYEESVFDYLLFRMEEQGAYFYFAPDGDRIVFADAPHAHEAPVGALAYSPATGLEGERRDEVITSFTLTQSPLPRRVVARGYDWKNPNRPVVGEAPLSEDGMGDVYLSGENVESDAEAERIARIRAEELICRSRMFSGAGSVPWLRPGLVFTLKRHYSRPFNRDYLITAVEHEGGQESFITLGLGIPLRDAPDHLFYRNSFTCIESDVQYRPARTAPRAKISGLIRAFVDGAGNKRAEMDEFGRYKLLFPFDVSGRRGGRASCWIRMAGPQAGKDSGLSFPLLPGTEVAVSFIDGNPDRPVITGALPNGETGAMTGRVNNNFSGIRTAGGNQITINDTDKKQGISLLTAAGRGLTMSAGSLGMTTKSGDVTMDAASTFTADVANAIKSFATGYKLDQMATQDPKWHYLVRAIAQAVEKSAKSVDDTLSRQSDSTAWRVETMKMLAANLSAGMDMFRAIDEKGINNYGMRLTADHDTARSRLLVRVSKMKMIALIAAWFAASSGAALIDANAGADDYLANIESAAWRKYDDCVNRAVAALSAESAFKDQHWLRIEGDDRDGIRYAKVARDLDDLIRLKLDRDEDVHDLRQLRLELDSRWNTFCNPESPGYFDSMKQRGRRKVVTSAFGELLPEIIALLTVAMDNTLLKSKKFGGIALASPDNNINLSAQKSISIHSGEGVFLGARPDFAERGDWGLDRAADDYQAAWRDMDEWTVTKEPKKTAPLKDLFADKDEDDEEQEPKTFLAADAEVELRHADVRLGDTTYEWMNRAGLHLLKTDKSSISMLADAAADDGGGDDDKSDDDDGGSGGGQAPDIDGIHLDSDKKVTLSATPNPADRSKDAVVAVEPDGILAAVQTSGILVEPAQTAIKGGASVLTLSDDGAAISGAGGAMSFGPGGVAVTSPGSVAIKNIQIDTNDIVSTSGTITLFGAIKIMGPAASGPAVPAAADPVTAKYKLYTSTASGDADQAMLKRLQDKLDALMPDAPPDDGKDEDEEENGKK